MANRDATDPASGAQESASASPSVDSDSDRDEERRVREQYDKWKVSPEKKCTVLPSTHLVYIPIKSCLK